MTTKLKKPIGREGMQAGRISGVSVCRSVAILLAMWSHVLVTFGARWDGTSYAWVRFTMQMAPVTFICLFGAMLEISYARKFREGKVEGAIQRMFVRAGQCYVLYAITILALLVAGKYSLGYTIRTIMLIGISPFTDILKFYIFALLSAPLLIIIRIKYGLWPLFIAFVVVQMAHPLVHIFYYTAAEGGKDYIGPVLGFLYGGSNAGVGAPSFIHGMALVCLGMVLGNASSAILGSDTHQRRVGLAWFGCIVAGSLAGSVFFWTDTVEVLHGIVTLKIRNDNHPFYYALGILATTAFLLICITLFDFFGLRFAERISFIGTVSLFTFCFGNVLLYLQPFGPPSPNNWGPALLFAALIPLQSWVFWRLTKVKDPAPASFAGVIQAIMRTANRYLDAVAAPAAKFTANRLTRHL